MEILPIFCFESLRMFFTCSNPLTTIIFTVFGHGLLEDRVLNKEAWVAKLLGTHLSIQVHKKGQIFMTR